VRSRPLFPERVRASPSSCLKVSGPIPSVGHLFPGTIAVRLRRHWTWLSRFALQALSCFGFSHTPSVEGFGCSLFSGNAQPTSLNPFSRASAAAVLLSTFRASRFCLPKGQCGLSSRFSGSSPFGEYDVKRLDRRLFVPFHVLSPSLPLRQRAPGRTMTSLFLARFFTATTPGKHL